MGKAISWIINIVRIVVLGIIAVTVWPTVVGIKEGKVTWDEAVDSLFSNKIITYLIIVLLLTLAISILRNAVARWAVSIAAAATLVCVITGTITLESVSDSVDAYHLATEGKELIEKCHMNVAVEEFGGKFRAVMKDPSEDRIMGYLSETADGVVSILDTQNNPMPCSGVA